MGCYQRETEQEHTGSQVYFHFLVRVFLYDNRWLGMYLLEDGLKCAATSVKLSRMKTI
jgi:hypothetical protein